MLFFVGLMGLMAVGTTVMMGSEQDEVTTSEEGGTEGSEDPSEEITDIGSLIPEDDTLETLGDPSAVAETSTATTGEDETVGAAPDDKPSSDSNTNVDTSGDDYTTQTGGEPGDTIEGVEGNEFLIGYGGDDVINGNGGFDQIEGGDGDDTLSGGADNDDLRGQDGDDVLSGDAGDDTL